MRKIVIALALGATLAGCASTSLKTPNNYPQLSVKADEMDTLVFTKPNIKLGQYTKAYVAPVLIKVDNGQGTNDVTDEEALRLANYTQQRLKEKLSQRLTLVGKPGADVLAVRFQITDMKPTSKAQVVMMVPPFAMINMLSPKGVFLGSITLAGELYEGLAPEPSVAFVASRSRPGIDASVAFSRWAVAEKIIDNATERLANDLTKEQAAGN